MIFLLGYWKQLAIAAITAIVLAYTYHAGGNAPRAELKALQTAADAYKAISIRIAQEKTDEYRKELAAIQSDWDLYRLQHPVTAPRRVNSVVCQDPGGNEAVSRAVSAYVASVGQFRTEVEGLIKQCDEQQTKLNATIEWARTLQ